jgi:hypothetical protein
MIDHVDRYDASESAFEHVVRTVSTSGSKHSMIDRNLTTLEDSQNRFIKHLVVSFVV